MLPPVLGLYVPAEQFVYVDPPSRRQIAPVGHVRHAADEVEPVSGLYVPCRQFEYADAPVVST